MIHMHFYFLLIVVTLNYFNVFKEELLTISRQRSSVFKVLCTNSVISGGTSLVDGTTYFAWFCG